MIENMIECLISSSPNLGRAKKVKEVLKFADEARNNYQNEKSYNDSNS